jgi:hypothetical protein
MKLIGIGREMLSIGSAFCKGAPRENHLIAKQAFVVAFLPADADGICVS